MVGTGSDHSVGTLADQSSSSPPSSSSSSSPPVNNMNKVIALPLSWTVSPSPHTEETEEMDPDFRMALELSRMEMERANQENEDEGKI